MKKRLGRKESVSKQGRKNAKPESTLDALDDLDADGRDYMETEDVVKLGRQSNETEELNKGSGEKGGSTKELVSTVVPKTVSTGRPELSTARLDVDAAQIREEKASKAAIAETYDEVQAGIDVDELFAAKLQHEEREEYTIEERAKVLAETIAAQRKFRAAQRSAEIRSRPPTKSQLRNLMMTYLKNMGGYKHSQLKSKTFAEIQGLYERQKKVLEEPNSTKVEIEQEGHEESIRKRPSRRFKIKATKKSKRQKTDDDLKEEEQIKAFLKIVPDEEGIIDYEVLEKRFLIINWESKFYDFDKHGVECIYYRIFRSDGSSRWIKTFSETVTRFDRLDLVELYNLVMKRFETTPEGVDLVLWGDLRTMFDANTEDELWHNQERWNLKS
ncbi:hypothetical protein Tco_0602311 [Tanacetum coccineum]